MYQDEFSAMSNAAAAKVGLLKKNPLGYFLMSMLAGAYIGFGILLIFTESGLMAGNPAAKIVMGASFCVALSLVIIAGAELFTGNTMVMTAGVLEGKIRSAELLKLWCVCWLGNVAGSVLLSLLFYANGLQTGAVAEAVAKGAFAKMSAGLCRLYRAASSATFWSVLRSGAVSALRTRALRFSCASGVSSPSSQPALSTALPI